jgi:hypothetical protein
MIASKSRFVLPGMLAVRLVAAVGSNERVRSSASRRLAGQMESIAQGVAQRAIELVIEALDVNALLARMDLNAVLVRVELNGLLGRVNLNQVLDRVDINQVLDRVDINQVLDRVDINQVLDRVDMGRLMARVDVNEIVDRIDIEALVANTDLGARMTSSTSTLATEAADLEDATRQAITGLRSSYSWADTIARWVWVSRLRHNKTGRTGPPELPNAQEEP